MAMKCDACGKGGRGRYALYTCEDCKLTRHRKCTPSAVTSMGNQAMNRRGHYICGTCADTACDWCGNTKHERYEYGRGPCKGCKKIPTTLKHEEGE